MLIILCLPRCPPTHSYSTKVIQNKVPTFGADIWSVMCVLVELLTAKQPWCFHQELSQHQLMFKVSGSRLELMCLS